MIGRNIVISGIIHSLFSNISEKDEQFCIEKMQQKRNQELADIFYKATGIFIKPVTSQIFYVYE